VRGSQWSLTVAVVAVRRGDGGSESDIGGVVAWGCSCGGRRWCVMVGVDCGGGGGRGGVIVLLLLLRMEEVMVMEVRGGNVLVVVE
jgi:hypothetical protein